MAQKSCLIYRQFKRGILAVKAENLPIDIKGITEAGSLFCS